MRRCLREWHHSCNWFKWEPDEFVQSDRNKPVRPFERRVSGCWHVDEGSLLAEGGRRRLAEYVLAPGRGKGCGQVFNAEFSQ